MTSVTGLLVALALVWVAPGATAQTSVTITSVSPDPAARSGRLVIDGSGFGAAQGVGGVEIGGVPAPTTTSWSDTRIVAYVPEEAPLGTVPVTVTTDAAATASATLSVTDRPPADGRVLWRFEVDAPRLTARPAVGPAGTIYAWDMRGNLYALASDGGLRWIYRGPIGGIGQVAVGADGTIYVAGDKIIHAVNPDGSRRWEFVGGDSQGVIAGPSAGPDGNVYAIFDIPDETPGAISFTPAGEVRWTNPGDPRFAEMGQTGKAIAFGEDQLYAPFTGVLDTRRLYGLTLDGSQRFAVPFEQAAGSGAEAAVGPGGDVYVVHYLSLKAVDRDGNHLWNALSATSQITSPSVGADGTIYAVEDTRELRALTPEGTIRWTLVADTILHRPIPSPLGDLLLMGGQIKWGERGLVQTVDTRGRALWQQIFPFEDGGYCPVPNTEPAFQADGSAAYLGVYRVCLADPGFAYLYAIQTGDGSTTPPPSSDTVSITKAEYDNRKAELRVEAQGSDPSATLRVYVTATDELIGTLKGSGGGRFRGTFSWPTNPVNITVRSSAGGSATADVSVK
jgi:hypothetical protein